MVTSPEDGVSRNATLIKVGAVANTCTVKPRKFELRFFEILANSK